MLATRLIAAIEVPFIAFDPGRLGASIGIYVTESCDLTDMLTCADEALYAAKGAGRNRYYVFDNILRGRLEMRRDIERDLSGALSDEALAVWYQPIFGADGRELINFEALIRWNHPKYGWVPPEDIISAASIMGLSQRLIHFIFGDVCSMIQTLLALGLGHIWVSMNISPRELSKIAIDDIISANIKSLGIPASMLELEITEETVIDMHSVQEKLSSLLRLGVRIAIDDFGTGYASLAILRQININRIKIDRSFVSNLANTPSGQILVQMILMLGYSLGVEVVAEGVESEEDFHSLQKLGCKLMQGYYLHRPVPRDQVIKGLLTTCNDQIAQDRSV